MIIVRCPSVVDIADNSGRTPLMIACLFGHTDVKLLLENGSNPNLISDSDIW